MTDKKIKQNKNKTDVKKKQPKPNKEIKSKEAKVKELGQGEHKAETKKSKEKKPLVPRTPSPFEKTYKEKCIPELMKKYQYKNIMQVPKITKIVINTCLKEALQDRKILDTAASEIATITGQKPVLTKSKKAIANFKLREGIAIGAQVTLRNEKMYEFMNRLVNVALPRVKDFKGVSSKAFDRRGNYTLGLTEQIIFPEINYDKVTKINGMNVTFVTTAKNDEEGRELLKLMGMPFKK